MTLDEAIAKLETEFGARDADHVSNDMCEVCSGDERADPTDPAPGLFLTKEQAIRAWYHAARDHLTEQRPSAWRIDGDITIDKWRITIADSMNTHRIANDRYSVSASIGVTWLAAAKD